MPIKVAILNPTIPPRSISLFSKINNSEDIDLYAVFFSISQKNRRWESAKEVNPTFPYYILNSISVGLRANDYHNTFVSLDIIKYMRQINPDIIILPGWSDITSLVALLWGRVHSKKIIIRTESTARETSWLRSLFLPITKLALTSSDLIIGSSQAAEEYASSLSPKTPHTHIYSSLDTRSFSEAVNKFRKHKRKTLIDLGVSQRHVVYYNGQYIRRKGIRELLEAFSRDELNNVALMLTGYGPLNKLVNQYVDKHNNIYNFNHIPYDVLPKFYSLADIFILPSHEDTWGVVVVEALSAGLPVITTKYVGSSELIDTRRGIVIDDVDERSIAKAIITILNSDLTKMGKRNQAYALRELNYDKIAAQFVAAIQGVVNAN